MISIKKIALMCIFVVLLFSLICCDANSTVENKTSDGTETHQEISKDENTEHETSKDTILPKDITEEQARETLQKYMQYSKIVEFFGADGARVQCEGIVYEWNLSDGKILNVTFARPDCGLAIIPDEYYLMSYDITYEGYVAHVYDGEVKIAETHSEEKIALDTADSKLVIEILNSLEWTESLVTETAYDYDIFVGEDRMHYISDRRGINDVTNYRRAWLTEEQISVIEDILNRYCDSN